jgi:hypothetical protein
LVDDWCDRHCLSALRHVLHAWPMSSELTDNWGELEISLKDLRAFARHELTSQQLDELNQCIRDIQHLVNRD